jgi:hypothetical protein
MMGTCVTEKDSETRKPQRRTRWIGWSRSHGRGFSEGGETWWRRGVASLGVAVMMCRSGFIESVVDVVAFFQIAEIVAEVCVDGCVYVSGFALMAKPSPTREIVSVISAVGVPSAL